MSVTLSVGLSARFLQDVTPSGGGESYTERVSVATPQARRSPGPDVARGVALAIVAMSNTVWWTYPPGPDGGSVLGESLDRWTGAFSVMFVSGRAYPMFSFLFGYGVVQMLTHLDSLGVGRRRAEIVVARRNLALVALGFLHALFLFDGDVLGAYGLLGFICLILARQQLSFVALIAIAFLCFRVLYDFQGWATLWSDRQAAFDIPGATSYVEAMGWRVRDWFTAWPVLPYYLAPMLLGVLAARRRILEEPARHAALLLVTISGGFALSILSGLPEALIALGRWQPANEPAWDTFTTLGEAGGIAGGIALAALSALLAHRAGGSGALHFLLEPLRCLGRRSLSGYLFQSLAFLLIFPAYTLGLGGKAGVTACYLVALAVWAVSLLLAVMLERAGRTGPGEWLLRRAAYGGHNVRPRQPTP